MGMWKSVQKRIIKKKAKFEILCKKRSGKHSHFVDESCGQVKHIFQSRGGTFDDICRTYLRWGYHFGEPTDDEVANYISICSGSKGLINNWKRQVANPISTSFTVLEIWTNRWYSARFVACASMIVTVPVRAVKFFVLFSKFQRRP